jgi:hypothetical protein
MDLKIDWLPVPHQPAATATFTFWEDAVTVRPWFVHTETFISTDRAVGDRRILSFVNEQVARAIVLYERLLAVRTACTALAAQGRTPVGLLWREVTCTDVANLAGVSVTQAFYTAVDAPSPWFSETRTISVTDPRITAASVERDLAARADRIGGMYARAAGLSAALSLPLGVRFTIPVTA